jgi:hypothetical protein
MEAGIKPHAETARTRGFESANMTQSRPSGGAASPLVAATPQFCSGTGRRIAISLIDCPELSSYMQAASTDKIIRPSANSKKQVERELQFYKA